MKVKVLEKFADRGDFSKKYNPGDIVEFNDDLAKELISRKLVEADKGRDEPAKKGKGESIDL